MSTTYEHTKQVTKLMAGSSQLLAILMSKLRSSLGAAWKQPRSCLEYACSMVRVCLCYAYAIPTRLRLIVTMFIFLVLGSGSVWGQDYSGVYYIASHGYNKANTETNYYLCPTENWYYYQPESPYYTNEYNGMPFMTTFQCRSAAYHEGDASAALWIIEKKTGTDYYYIKHAANNQYLTYNTEMGNGSNVGRMRLHLEEMADGDNALFQITYVPAVSAYDITTKNSGPDANRKYLNVTGNVADGNQASLQATGTKKDGPDKINVGGIIGLWTSGANSDVNGRWYLEKAKCKTPVITFDNVTSEVTITSDDDETIYYTTDGNNPDAVLVKYNNAPFELTEGVVIKAVSKKNGLIDSEIATLTVEKLATPTISFNEETREVTITAAEGVEIYYTTDDTDLTIEETTAHAASPVVIAHALPSTKIHARAVKSGSIHSEVAVKTDIPVRVLTTPTVILSENEFVYDGSAKEPAITVKDGDVVVSTDEYVVTYSDNTNAGTASVTISDRENGDYEVNAAIFFTISPKSLGNGDTTADGISLEMTEDGSLSAVKDGSTTLVENTDYTQGTIEDGSDKIITITGMGNYTGGARGIYASPQFDDPDGDGGPGQAAAVYMAKRDLSCPSGINPYIIRKVNPSMGTAVITPLDYIPEDVPVLLLSDDEASGFVASPKDPSTPDVTAQTKNSNLLKVSAGGETVGAAQIYMFYKGEFVLTKAGTLGEGKFYLYNPNYTDTPANENSGNSESRGLLQFVIDDEEPTGITEFETSTTKKPETDIWYTLDGRRLSVKPTKAGIYIHQGQKEYIKR